MFLDPYTLLLPSPSLSRSLEVWERKGLAASQPQPEGPLWSHQQGWHMNQQRVPCTPPRPRWLHIPKQRAAPTQTTSPAEDTPRFRPRGNKHCASGGDIFTEKGMRSLLLFSHLQQTSECEMPRAQEWEAPQERAGTASGSQHRLFHILDEEH